MKITKKESNRLQFKEVELREPVVGDLIHAERVTGKVDGVDFSVALLSAIGTFDGKTLPPEELSKLSAADFLALSRELDTAAMGWPNQSSTLSEKQE